MKTSEVAAQAQVNTQALRYYERRGLLPEPMRTPSGYRDYGDDAVRVVRFVKRAQQLGFTLDDIEDLLHLAGGGPDSCDEARAMARGRIEDLQLRIDELVGMRDALARLIETCGKPRAERQCPILHDIEGSRRHEMTVRIELLNAPGCPHAAAARETVIECLSAVGVDATIVDRVGRYPSPTVLVDGVDVMRPESGVPIGDACRLDLPTPQRVLDALRRRIST